MPDSYGYDETLAEARDLLRELIACTMREARCLPDPSVLSGLQVLVVPPVQIALKAAFYEAFRGTGLSRRDLARKLGVAERDARRMLNPAAQPELRRSTEHCASWVGVSSCPLTRLRDWESACPGLAAQLVLQGAAGGEEGRERFRDQEAS